MKILFVCTGNTCRSPLAQGLATHYLPESFEISSSGISAYEGQPVSENAVQALKEKKIDIRNNKAVKLHEKLLRDADYVFAMTKKHEHYLVNAYPEFRSKITRLGDFVGCNKDISDPWGGSLDDYKDCAKELEEMLLILAEKLDKSTENSWR
ncbi:MAG: hypothetical protein APF84_04880 [Gracilibacter sp. BRH_c7a]|nr:MAG: hypothetical protein APF84_04880 [Gracilibacter sp. BRH_c7a]